MHRSDSHSISYKARQEKAKSGGFLDQLFGRPKHRQNLSGSRSQLSSQTKVHDGGGGGYTTTNNGGGLSHVQQMENEEQQLVYALEHMDEQVLCSKFEEMLSDMNLTEEKKEPLRKQPLENKKMMVLNHYKGKIQDNKSKFDRPIDYIQYLTQNDLSINKLYNCVESLRVALTNNTLSWTEEFGTKGLKCIINILNDSYASESYANIAYECLRCVRALMNNTVGLKYIFVVKESLTIVSRSLNPDFPSVMCEAAKVLAAFCLVPDGHDLVLEALTIAGEMKGKERFSPMVYALSNKNHEQMRVSCFQLINAIISRTDDLDFRLHLRNEIMRNGLSDIWDSLKSDQSKDLMIQTEVFEKHREDDFEEFCSRFDNIRMEMDDVNECFDVIKSLVIDSPAEPYFLSILQHLLFIRDDHIIRPAYYKLIEECITQIVLHKNGLDPDFNQRFEIDVQPLLESLEQKEKSQAEENNKLEELKLKLEHEISLRQEAEAKLTQVEQKLKEFGATASPPTSKTQSIARQINIPPPPPLPGGHSINSGNIPPPPPTPFGGLIPPPPAMPGMGGIPPPPPPMMGINGGPPPPPMPGGLIGQIQKPPDVLPYGLKPKKKWDISGPLKKANWKTIGPQKMSEKSFWLKVEEDKLASPDILNGLAQKFSTKPPQTKKPDDVVDKSGQMKKMKELRVLDAKAAQNISILLGGSFKHLTYSNVKQFILQCDQTVLTHNVLQQLIQYLPPGDQLKKLQDLKGSYDELTEAEQFCVVLSDIKRLLPRLKSLSFRLHYSEMVQDTKPDIVAGTAACEEIKSSKKFAKILELILLLGNYMNSGTKSGQAFGFEFSFLTKLTGTKDYENKRTLLHYLVEIVESKFGDLINFYDEIPHVDRASRVSMEMIQKNLRQMSTNIKNLETDLLNSKIPQSQHDLFNQVMTEFAVQAREQCDILYNMYKQMESLYGDLAEYYAFDKQKYSFDEFFTDIKTFKYSFIEAHKDNTREREQEEKLERQKLARELAEKEKLERAKRKKQLVDMNEAQEGVMDSLLEALQTGSAFSREQKRKRGPRVAGAERRAQLNRSRSRSGLVGTAALSRDLSSEFLT